MSNYIKKRGEVIDVQLFQNVIIPLQAPLIKNFGVFQVIRKIASMLVHMDVELQLTQVI